MLSECAYVGSFLSSAWAAVIQSLAPLAPLNAMTASTSACWSVWWIHVLPKPSTKPNWFSVFSISSALLEPLACA